VIRERSRQVDGGQQLPSDSRNAPRASPGIRRE
jgi:hypothetical protein